MRDLTNYLLSKLRLNSDASRTRDENATDGTGAVISIDIGHNRIHQGHHFYHKGFKSLGSSASYVILLKTGIDKLVHFNFYVTSPGEMTLSLLEDVTVTLDGTSLSVFNNKRGAQGGEGFINTMTMFHTPTTSGGSEIFPASVGAGTPLGGGGDIRNECELILKQSKNYKMTLTNAGSQTAILDYYFCWYEITS